MPIRLAADFPAKAVLESEDIFAIADFRAKHQDIRPLKLLILNLMPNKIDTEIHLLRLISQSPLQIDVNFLKITSHEHKHTSKTHLDEFYLDFSQVKETCYDGLIITGAPVEQLAFEEVDYWPELVEIMEWSQSSVTSVVHICWGAQAGLYHHFGVDKVAFKEKLFGIYKQAIKHQFRLFRGFDDRFWMPQSRYTGIDEEQVRQKKIRVIAKDESGQSTILISEDEHDIFLMGHFEYGTDTLEKEYLRDRERGIATAKPQNYYEDGNIHNSWRAQAHLFYHNWLNDVYQFTPYRLEEIRQLQKERKLRSI
ncbi:homoserine O-succinyltransferase [Enterococcus xiangfangensis]|uniref:homoserine O-succinyltransferase n=1 Tax=Enterococcus xiangfangensis TaxID=1296537 RepID=UPI0010F4A521|nr:homoserine O-succinyltransferase [Enterococcus xiangfangensis]MBM7712591.1 homoserine O-succinyltransferase [Enterococcus xiangfangensis]NBK08688.1 homoserine O-succinyltransferase [Enterococcus asini]